MSLKIFSIIIALFSSSLVFANPADLNLTAKQEQAVIRHLDSICADAWCAGEFNLSFKSVQFGKVAGFERYAVAVVAQNAYDNKIAKLTLVCEVQDIQAIQDLANSDINGNYADAEQQLFNSIDSCVTEKLLPHLSDLLGKK